MTSNKLAIWFVQEIVIGFGFFTGFWLFVGVDPEAEMVNSILNALKAFSSSIATTFAFYYWLLTMVFAVVSIVLAYVIGKWAGLLAVFFAFIGGLFITSIGIWLLLVGVCLGFVAPFLKEEKESEYTYF